MKNIALSIGAPIEINNLLAAFSHFLLHRDAQRQFATGIARFLGKKNIYFVNSGTTAFYLILKALKKFQRGEEVILPAYTAPSLVLPIKKAGLKTVLCDISLETFNMDLAALPGVVSPNTLCIVPVHMFGLPMDMGALLQLFEVNSIYLVEDAASSMGSKFRGKQTGTFTQAGFYSFNRGKNYTTFCGGCIVTDDTEFNGVLRDELRLLHFPSKIEQFLLLAKLFGLYLAFKPAMYTFFKSVISRFKYERLHHDFSVYLYNGFQGAFGMSLLTRMDDMFERRRKNGIHLYQALQGTNAIKLPSWPEDSEPVFNQFPILVEDPRLRNTLNAKLNSTGIESTILYPYPVHMAYNIGYDVSGDLFPNAEYLSKRLLLIPVHPLVEREALDRAVDIIRHAS